MEAAKKTLPRVEARFHAWKREWKREWKRGSASGSAWKHFKGRFHGLNAMLTIECKEKWKRGSIFIHVAGGFGPFPRNQRNERLRKMKNTFFLKQEQWYRLNGTFRPDLKSDVRDFKKDLTRVRTWQGESFTVVETFYFERRPDGSVPITEVTWLFTGEKSLVEGE